MPGCEEHYLLHCMRNHSDFIPELDFLVEVDGNIVAHVAYVKSRLLDEEGNQKIILSFGPISVHPDYQRQGYGKKLLSHSFEKAKELGYEVIAILGNPENYICNGFKCAKKYNVSCGDDNYDPTKVEEFDRDFEQMEKAYCPSQELFYIYSKSSVTW